MAIHKSLSNSMTVGAFNHAMAEKSDPFAYSRAMSHIQNGICDPKFNSKTNERIDCHYEAELTAEKRSYTDANGNVVEFTVPAYINQKRP